ncbi:MAG: DUF1330 domain-containing protein [Myxococcota bacterium]
MEAKIIANRFVEAFGDGADGAAPSTAQWERLLARPEDAPVTLVNLFKMRETAHYPAEDGHAEESPASGEAAFARYAQVSMPAMDRVGGRFLAVAPHQGGFLGDEEDWDLVAIGQYPTLHALIALYDDTAYQAAYRHRRAACARQRVFVVGA